MGVWRGSGWGRSFEIAGTEQVGGRATSDVRAVQLPFISHPVSIVRVQIAVALLVLNVCDVVLTKLILARGGAEGNPLMAGLMEGTMAPLGVKALCAATAGILLFMCPPDSRFANKGAATVAGLYLGVIAWNASLLGWLLFTR